MNKLVFLSLLLTTAFNGLIAQEKKQKDEMVFEKTVDNVTKHDYGSIIYGADGSVDFVFTNEGKNPLVITNVASTCGCTVPTWPKEPIEPGKKGTITVVYNTKLVGPFNKTIVVYSNANNSPVRISILGKVNAKFSDVDPGKKDATGKNAEQIRQGETDAVNSISPQLNSEGGLPADKMKKKQIYQSQIEKSNAQAEGGANSKTAETGANTKSVNAGSKK